MSVDPVNMFRYSIPNKWKTYEIGIWTLGVPMIIRVVVNQTKIEERIEYLLEKLFSPSQSDRFLWRTN